MTKAKPQYKLIVGNVGTIYEGPDEARARAAFNDYREFSRCGYGRVSGESVTLLCDNDPEPLEEWVGGKVP